MKLVSLAYVLLFLEGAQSFVPLRVSSSVTSHERNNMNVRIVNKQIKSRGDVAFHRNAALGLSDFPLIPSVLLATLGIFALFNIDNDVDLTDAGRADARRKRRAERIARGEDMTSKSNPFKKNKDPYRWRIFEDDTDDDNFEMY